MISCSRKINSKLSNYLNNKGNYFGIDNEKTMAILLKKFKRKNITIEFKDINQVKLKKIFLYYLSIYTSVYKTRNQIKITEENL